MAKATITNISDHLPPQQPQEPQPPTAEDVAHLRKTLKLGDKFRDMESKLHDLRNMAGVAADYVEDALSSNPYAEMTGSPNYYFFQEGETERILFTVYHLQNMIGKLVDDYLAAYHQEEAPPAA